MKYHIFDLDGTLIDSMEYWAQAMIEILIEGGIEPPEDIIRIITPLGAEGTAKYYVKMGISGTVESIMDTQPRKLVPYYTDVITLKPFVKEYLSSLKAKGDRIYVLTASPHAFTDPVLKRNGIYDLFDAVWSSDDFDYTKVQCEIYRQAAQQIGCRVEDIVFYEDNANAIKVGNAAGVETVGLYDKTSAECSDEVPKVCGKYVMSFEELL